MIDMKFDKFKNLIIMKTKSISNQLLKKTNNKNVSKISMEVFNFGGVGYEEVIQTNTYTNEDFSSLSYSLKNKKNPFLEKFKFIKKEDMYNKQFWDTILHTNNKDKIQEIFFNQDFFSDVVSSHTLQLIKQKYKKIICQDYHSIEEGIQFLKKHDEDLSTEDLIGLLTKVNQNNYVANKLDEEGYLFMQSKYKGQIFILDIEKAKKNSLVEMKNEKLWFNLIEEKFSEKLKDKEVMLEIIKKSRSDTFLYLYLTKYFEHNTDHEQKIEVINNLQITFTDTYIPNILLWVKENNLLEVFLSNKEVLLQMVEIDAYNHLFPLFIEKYNVKPDEIIKHVLAGQKTQLFNIMWNNYSFEQTTQQKLAHMIFILNDTKLAEDCFKRGFSLSNTCIEEINVKPNEAGHILMKSTLKNNLENKYNKQLDKQKVRKI